KDPTPGFYYASILLVVNTIEAFLLSQCFNITYKTGACFRSALVTALYKKSMLLSSKSRSMFNTGDVVNRMSVDAQRINDFIGHSHPLWSSPFQVCITLYLLYQTLGWSAYAGVAIMCLAVPANAYIAKKLQVIQEQQMESKDARTHLVEESLQGIKVLKLYAWETPFLERIAIVRNCFEIECLRKIGLIYSIQTAIIIFTPFLVTFVTYSVYVAFDNNSRGTLDAGLIFVSLALFNMLQFPLIILPFALTLFIEARVGIRRIKEYLVCEELEKNVVTRLPFNRRSATKGPTEISSKPCDRKLESPVNGNSSISESKSTTIKEENETVVSMENVELWWDYTPGTSNPALKNINLSIHSSELVAVVGRVGSGKSSLLQSLLGELYKPKGKITVKGQVAYVNQQPWIMNATLRENILFGRKYDENIYSKVIFACCLTDDLMMLPNGDMTEIGEKGINLSGGQKARVGLARAIYSSAEVYLLDDPLAAVDAHVGAHLFKYVLGPGGILNDRARILVTNAIQYLELCSSVIILQSGNIVEQGEFSHLMDKNGLLAALVRDYSYHNQVASGISTPRTPINRDENTPVDISSSISLLQKVQRTILEGSAHSNLARIDSPEDKQVRFYADMSPEEWFRSRRASFTMSRPSIASSMSSSLSNVRSVLTDEQVDGRLITTEHSQVGKVSAKIYINYARYCGIFSSVVFIIALILSEGIIVASTAWLKYWAESNERGENYSMYYLGIYLLLGIVFSLFSILRSYAFMAVGVVNVAIKSHELMLSSIFKSPMSFFDTTPLGRILNRFSRDQAVIDEELPQSFSDWLLETFLLVFNFLAIAVFLPLFIVVMIPMFVMFYIIQKSYLYCSRDLKRLDSVSKSPIYQHFQESLDGVSTIRAYSQVGRFIKENERRLDENQKPVYHFFTLNRWISCRLDILVAIMIFSITFISIYVLHFHNESNIIDPSVVGMTINYALVITASLNWCIRMYCKTETDIISMERVDEYSNLPSEPVNNPEGAKDPEYGKLLLEQNPLWPQHGKIEFIDYSTKYRENLDPVLTDINVTIKGGEKIGIVGRTGSGKSSFTLGLFRIIEPATGKIMIDGIDITKIRLPDLRSQLCIIPQDPVIFSGTVRFNLFPFFGNDMESELGINAMNIPDSVKSKHEKTMKRIETQFGSYFTHEQPTDAELWEALEAVNLREFVDSLDGKLDAKVSRAGQNFSVGQKQLICLARALVRKSQIIVLDEATASIDHMTDEIIQSTLRSKFKDCTIITIAHRLNTVLDSDRILVLSNGAVAEFDSPANLLDNPESMLSSLAQQYGSSQDAT
ncbi:hypothetical protein BB560_004760, partial [Smittium megazygosporum]